MAYSYLWLLVRARILRDAAPPASAAGVGVRRARARGRHDCSLAVAARLALELVTTVTGQQ